MGAWLAAPSRGPAIEMDSLLRAHSKSVSAQVHYVEQVYHLLLWATFFLYCKYCFEKAFMK